MNDNIVPFPKPTSCPHGLTQSEIQLVIAFAYRLMALGIAYNVTSKIDDEGHKSVVIVGRRKVQICKGRGIYAAFLGRHRGMIAGCTIEEVLDRTDHELTQMLQAYGR